MAPPGVGKGRAFSPALARKTKSKAVRTGVGNVAKTLATRATPGARLVPTMNQSIKKRGESAMTPSEELYMLGFIDKCAELGVDPEELVKQASKLRQSAHKGTVASTGAAPTPPAPPVVAQPNPGLMSRLLRGRGDGGLGPGLRGFGRLGLRGGLTSAQ